MGDERAETYVARLAEAELRRVSAELRRLDAAAEDPWADPGMPLFTITEGASWKVGRAARILVAAGVLDQDYVHDVGADLGAAIQVRSRLLLNWYRRQGVLHRTLFEPPVRRPSRGARQPMRVTPADRALRGASDQAPWTLHFMSLMRTETEAVITVAMRMHWPPDGPGTARAGPHHMPYDRLEAVDDQGTCYTVRFEGGRFRWNWTPGFSWWLRDRAGNWHVGTPGEPDTYGDGMSVYMFGDGLQAFWLRLTPPLAVPGLTEIVVTGPATRARATLDL